MSNRIQRISFLCSLLALFIGSSVEVLPAETLRVLPEGELPQDRRLQRLKNLSDYFPFKVPESKEAWQRRSEKIERQILVSNGLWPMPPKTPLNAVIHGRVEREGFTVEKVYFESLPGHFVTGLLFRPTDSQGKLPAVLSPHGHGGRDMDLGVEEVRKQIVLGQERFEKSGRVPKLARCAQLARMGCVTFIFDMLGFVDSQQLAHVNTHSRPLPRPHLDDPSGWGLVTTQAELRMQSVMGLQTLNAIRALDFLCSLPDVDPSRVGVTGGSGGGTQTILLGAIDPRPVVTFPQGMVSTAMQGGCVCENAALLRVGTGNVELAALMAPKPMAMTAANDWTKEMMTKGYPQLQQLYEMLGAKGNVHCESTLHLPHNFNYPTRAMMYAWMNQHLGLGLEEPIVEEDYELLTKEESTVWNAEHPAPPSGEAYEISLTKQMHWTAQQQITALHPHDADSLEQYRYIVGGAIEAIVGRDLDEIGTVKRTKVDKFEHDDYLLVTDLLAAADHGEQFPVVWFYPTAKEFNGDLIVWVDGDGKAALFDGDKPRAEVLDLLNRGFAVVGLDMFLQGEFLADGKPVTETRTSSSWRPNPSHNFCYNSPLFVRRVHDVMTLVKFAREDDQSPTIHVVGANGAGPIAAMASAVLGDAVKKRVIDTQGFRFETLRSFRDPDFVPGMVKYGDVPALLALSAPHPLWVVGEGKLELPRQAYQASSSMRHLGPREADGDLAETLNRAFR